MLFSSSQPKVRVAAPALSKRPRSYYAQGSISVGPGCTHGAKPSWVVFCREAMAHVTEKTQFQIASYSFSSSSKFSFNDVNYHQVPIPIPPINGHKNRRSRIQDQSKVVTIRWAWV